MSVCRLSLLAEFLICDLKGCSGGKHGVCKNQNLAGEVWSSDVLDVDVEVLTLVIFSVGCHECILSIIEIIEDTLMQRKSCAEDCSYNHLVVICRNRCDSERSCELFFRIVEALTDLVTEDFAYSFKVSAEAHAVFLDFSVAELSDKLI